MSCDSCGADQQRGRFCIRCGTALLKYTQPVLLFRQARRPPAHAVRPPVPAR